MLFLKRFGFLRKYSNIDCISIDICVALFILCAARAVDLMLGINKICQFDGCQVVEQLTKLPKGYFEIFGASYFGLLLVVWYLNHNAEKRLLYRQLLLSGVAVEGFLVGYQIYVAHTFCVFCLIICGSVLSLAFLEFRKTPFTVIAVFSSLLFIMPFVTYGSFANNLQDLTSGAVARRVTTKASQSQDEYTLIFSENCEHCQHVLKRLETVSWATIYFNPIAPLSNTKLCTNTDLALHDIDCSINQQFLTILGEKGVPILLAKLSSSEMRIYKGDKTIIRFLNDREKVLNPITPISKPAARPSLFFTPESSTTTAASSSFLLQEKAESCEEQRKCY